MAGSFKLIEGVVEDPRDDEIRQLRDENEALREMVRQSEQAAANAQRDATRAIGRLRHQLEPLYRALRGIFGEMDAAGVSESASPTAPAGDPRVAAVWASWKSKLGQGAAKCIDALLLHGEMNTQQLSIATGYHRNTVPQYVSQLHKAGLIEKNDGRFKLKQI